MLAPLECLRCGGHLLGQKMEARKFKPSTTLKKKKGGCEEMVILRGNRGFGMIR